MSGINSIPEIKKCVIFIIVMSRCSLFFRWYLLPYHRSCDLQSPLQWVRYNDSCCPQSSGAVSSSLSRRNQFLNNNRRLYSRVSRKEGVSPLFVYTAIHVQGCFHSNSCSLTASGIGLPQKIYILRNLEAHFTLISCVCWFDKFHMVVLLYFPPSIRVFVPRVNRITTVPGLMQSWNSGQQLNVAVELSDVPSSLGTELWIQATTFVSNA
jgi:hypothetical protein